MNLENAMFLWMPVDAELYHDNPRQGRVLVVERGQDNPEYPMSAGACDIDWNEAGTNGERFEKLQGYVSTMVWDHGIGRDAILGALAVIDDINPLQLNFQMQPIAHDD